jgi:hypothetical protein
MRKDDRIQVRIDPNRKEFLREYAERKDVTISKIFMDFVDWLIRRERSDRTQEENGTGS